MSFGCVPPTYTDVCKAKQVVVVVVVVVVSTPNNGPYQADQFVPLLQYYLLSSRLNDCSDLECDDDDDEDDMRDGFIIPKQFDDTSGSLYCKMSCNNAIVDRITYI